jgi:hypothetical protein
MLEILLLRPRAKKDVWLSRRVVRVVWDGVRVRSAGVVSGAFIRRLKNELKERTGLRLTEQEVLDPEEEVERNILCFGLCEQEKREHVKESGC